jgi:hypothetical protein
MTASHTLPLYGETAEGLWAEPGSLPAGASAFEAMLWLSAAARRAVAGLAGLTRNDQRDAEGEVSAPEVSAAVQTAEQPASGRGATERQSGDADDPASAVRALPGALPGLAQVLALVPTAELAGLFGELVALRALAEGISTAVLAEAVARGVVAGSDGSPRPIGPKITSWVGEQAAQVGHPVTTAVAGTYRRVWEDSRCPELAPLTAAIQSGRISLAVGARLGGDLKLLAVAIPPDWWEPAAQELISHAASGASISALASIREALIANYGGEGDFEDQQDRLHQERCFATPVKNAAGLWVGTYAMDNDAHAALQAALDALAAPCRTAEGEVDTRTAGQRNLDAIIEMCRVVATDPTLSGHVRPASATKAQIIVTLDYDTLATHLSTPTRPTSPTSRPAPAGAGAPGRTNCGGNTWTGGPKHGCCGPVTGETGCDFGAATSADSAAGEAARDAEPAEPADMAGRTGPGRRGRGYGVDGHGNPLTPATIRRLACDALLIPAVLGSDSAVLDLGRAARFASADQIRFLRLRDKGCTFPGCDRPPSWCDAHHLREWEADQGETTVDNLALLCTRHHTDIHRRGLIGRLSDGTIHWTRRA